MGNIFDLTGKAAVVVGGGSGLGKGMATGLAQAGATVILAGRRKDVLIRAKEEIEEQGGTCIPMTLDITSPDAVRDFVEEIDQQYGRIDILVNSAGINIRKPALDFETCDWDKVTDTQQKYMFFTCQQIGRYMVEHGIKGRIINMASLTSTLGLKNMVAYCASKGAVAQITKALANEWAQYGITVNAIAPGYYLTEMTRPLLSDPDIVRRYEERIPAGRLGTPEDLISTVVYLACDASAYVTGQVIYVDGGWTIN